MFGLQVKFQISNQSHMCLSVEKSRQDFPIFLILTFSSHFLDSRFFKLAQKILTCGKASPGFPPQMFLRMRWQGRVGGTRGGITGANFGKSFSSVNLTRMGCRRLGLGNTRRVSGYLDLIIVIIIIIRSMTIWSKYNVGDNDDENDDVCENDDEKFDVKRKRKAEQIDISDDAGRKSLPAITRRAD